jgi:hypothetical protein
MPRNNRTQNGRSNVRVLHFPTSTPATPSSDTNTDALADAIRKAWTQKPSTTKRAADLIRLRPADLLDNAG